jgi:hypothetical protein
MLPINVIELRSTAKVIAARDLDRIHSALVLARSSGSLNLFS